MPLLPNFLERTIFFTLNQGPAPLLDMFGAIGFRVMATAIKMGVFEALQDGAQTREELAKKLCADSEGMRLMLDTLESLGYVRKQGESYANTPMTAKWLVASSPTNFAPFCLYWDTILSGLMTNLDESIRTGHSPENLYSWIENQPETSGYFQQAMTTMARFGGDDILGKLKLPAGPTRLLDIGGGHAMYSIAMCEKHSDLTATVLDSPQALETARQNIAATKMEKRVLLQEGDFLKSDYGAGYDMAFLFNIIHGLTPELNRDLLRKAWQALKPGGQVVIVEQLPGSVSTPIGKASTRLLGLAYFHLIEGKTYTYEDLQSWLRDTGYGEPQKHGLLKAPGNYVIVAQKAG
jgi:predicted O-methyltransferase YrrM